MNTEINIGIDTSQSQLDIFVRPLDVFFSVENSPQGVKEAVKRLRSWFVSMPNQAENVFF